MTTEAKNKVKFRDSEKRVIIELYSIYMNFFKIRDHFFVKQWGNLGVGSKQDDSNGNIS